VTGAKPPKTGVVTSAAAWVGAGMEFPQSDHGVFKTARLPWTVQPVAKEGAAWNPLKVEGSVS
jgi:hypothetical protein